MLRASAAVERAGVPSVSVIASGFLKQAEVVAKGLGLPDLAIAEFPGVPMTYSEEGLRREVEEVLLPRIIDGLSNPQNAPTSTGIQAAPQPRDIVFRGTLDEVQEHFHRNFWSDGLPIIPPTPERVDRFLRFTERDPDEVIGMCPPANRQATVWNVAVNGVMAGCRPEYMPILLAVVEAVSDPAYKVEDAGSTPGWESLIVLNGPIVKQLEFNSGQGVMRVGKQANTSVGRFLRLYLRNLAGFYHAPEGADKGSIAQSFLVALPENEDAVAEIGWQPYSVDRGFTAGDNIVTVQSVVAISAPAYSQSEHAIEHARLLADVIGERACGYWTAVGMCYANWHPLIMLGPSIARVFAKDGWSKDDIRKYLYENVKIEASRAEYYAYAVGLTGFRINDAVKQGLLPPVYHESDDPDRMVPVFQRPEWIGIVVAGDWGRNQSKGYVSNHVQGPPVSRKIVLPKNWDALLAEARR
ncbi:MAG: hypothetical protein A3G24_24510 [Betaproteobacteria bacterium RIFCSPLOWO2_12_FULL_62_13]|nr:MAG: hypothetical protein A3G24_24510 [Betaproteobacteria bacterium RIFCSPLOWO2_12_FULL_62_13]